MGSITAAGAPRGLWRSRWAAIGAAIAVALGAGGIAAVNAQSTGPASALVPIVPCRLVDTRPAPETVGTRATPLGNAETATFSVRGANGNCNIASNATGISTNVTIVSPTGGGFLTLFPGGATRPSASNLNWVAGQAPTPNAVTVGLGTGGTVSVYNHSGTVNVIIDIVGYYEPSTSGPAGPTGATGPQGPAGQVGPIQPQISTSLIARLQWWAGARTDHPTGSGPIGVAFDGTNIWVTNFFSNNVSKINPTTGTTISTHPTGTNPTGIAFDGTNIWVTNNGSNNVTKINPATGATISTTNVGTSPTGIAFDGTNIWVTNQGSANVTKINPTTGTTISTTNVGIFPTGVAFDGTNIWVTNNGPDNVTKINPTTGTTISTTNVGTNPTGIAFDGTNIWVTNNGSNTVTKINPTTGATISTHPTGTNPAGIVFDGTNIWIINSGPNTVTKINPTTGATISTHPTGTNSRNLAFDGTNIWITNFDSNTVSKMTTVADNGNSVLWAKVDGGGPAPGEVTLLRGAGATAASHFNAGSYLVTFNRPVDTCGWSATLNDNGAAVAPNGQISVELRNITTPNDLIVRTFTANGTTANLANDDGFTLTVNC